VKRFSFYSLRVRLILLVLIAIIPALGLLVHTAWEHQQQAASEIQNHVIRLANLAAREEGRLIFGTRQTLISMAQFLYLNHRDRGKCSAFFTALLKEYRRYANLGAVKPNGDVLCSAVPLKHPINATDRLWFTRAMETRRFAIGGYQIGRITGEPVIVAAYPVLDKRGQILAVVFAALDLKWLNLFNAEVKAQLPMQSRLFMMDHRGVILAHHPHSEKLVGRTMADKNLLKTIFEQKQGLIKTNDSDGIQWLNGFTMVFRRLEARTVYLVISIPKKVVFAHANRILSRNLIGLGIVALLALIAAWIGGEVFVLRRVKAIADAAERLKKGNLGTSAGMPHGRGELAELSRVFDEMSEAIERREAERMEAEEHLKISREELRNLSLHLQSAIEEERASISREIHDVLGQELTALKMDISWLGKRVNKSQELLVEKLESMSKLVDTTIRDVQRISTGLRPALLDDLGLAAAIEWQAEEFYERTGIPCKVVFSPKDIILDKDLSITIFRILQEALTNIMRHADATNVHLRLKEKDSTIVLEVKDNGKGIMETDISDPRSIGLIGIRERVRFLDGEVDIVGVQNKGTRVKISIPLDKKEKSND
jgi:signal transduction histidine kinase